MVDDNLKGSCVLFLDANITVLDWTISANESEAQD